MTRDERRNASTWLVLPQLILVGVVVVATIVAPGEIWTNIASVALIFITAARLALNGFR